MADMVRHLPYDEQIKATRPDEPPAWDPSKPLDMKQARTIAEYWAAKNEAGERRAKRAQRRLRSSQKRAG